MRMTQDNPMRAHSSSSLWQRLMFRVLARISTGYLVIEDGTQTHTFGQPDSTPKARIQVLDPAVYREFVLNGDMGAAEAWVLGLWDTHDLTQIVRLFARNLDALEPHPVLSRLRRVASWLDHALNRNTLNQARANIAAHYDLGNDLFEQFLDPSMMYSSAIFPQPDASLEDAQAHRLQRIGEKLALKPQDHLLEIGTGWGGLAIYMAKHFGCRVTTTTISQKQYQYARAQVEAAGLQDRITLLDQDYRQLTGRYDKLVSLEMIEAVGHEYLDSYFRQCDRLLKPDGLMLLQAITIADQRYEAYRRGVDFIQKYIFPGGALPSVARLTGEVARSTELVLRHLDDFGVDYARTLQHWRERFNRSAPILRERGYDEAFQRLWNYYFSYCEGGFLERNIGVVQMVLTKPEQREVQRIT